MNSARWQQIKQLFKELADLDEAAREQRLTEIYPTDSELATEVRVLLVHDRRTGGTWEHNIRQLAEPEETSEGDWHPNQDLPNYRLLRVLGAGGMGTVFEGEHKETRQRVAIKVLRSGELSAASRERFATEQRALARLDHPLIARLYASENFWDGTPCFVMEYVEGKALTDYCRDNKTSVRDRLRLFRQVCEAVQHAHERGVIHRDLKPSNILVKQDGAIRLLDFGIAKQLDAETPLTVSGLSPAPMTLAYAAPEQVDGGTSGTHTDVYSLGATLYELLTGNPPFGLSGKTPAAVQAAICTQEPKRPSLARTDLTDGGGVEKQKVDWKDLDVLCLTAMHKDPVRRYRSVDALIRDLGRWLANEPLEARGDSAWYKLKKFGRRNTRSLLMGFAIVFLIIGATVWFTLDLKRARDEALRQQARTKRVEQFIFSVFRNGNAKSGFPKDTKALDLLDRGRRLAEAMRSDPEFQVELYSVLGRLYQNQGQFEIADRLLSSVTDQLGRTKFQEVEFAHSQIALSLLRADEFKFREAETLARNGLKILESSTAATAHDIAAAKSALATALLLNRDFRQSMTLMEGVLSNEELLTAEDKADALNLLGQSYQLAEDYTTGVAQIEKAIAINRGIYGNLDPRVASDIQVLGSIRIMQLRLPEAENAYAQAIQIYDGWYGPKHPKTIESRILLGQVQVFEGKYDVARDLIKENLAAGTEVMGQKNDVVALAVGLMGTLEQNTGNYNEARQYFERSLASARAIWGDDTELTAIAEANLATLENKAGNAEKAEPLYRAAIVTLKRLTPLSGNIARLQINLGKALAQLHRDAEAERELRQGITVLKRDPVQRPHEIEKAEALLQELSAK